MTMKIKPQNITTFNPEEFVVESSKILNKLILDLLKKRDRINIALSGGSSPLPIYNTLGKYNLDWNRIEFFLVDERCVSIDSKHCNYKNIKDFFFSKIPSQTYPITNEKISFHEAAVQYQDLIKSKLKTVNGLPQFDLIILGMGLDGHTASLFPNTRAIDNLQDLVVLNYVPQLETYRITMTYPLILNAKKTVLIANGEAKKKVLDNIFENKHPISKIIPQIYHILN